MFRCPTGHNFIHMTSTASKAQHQGTKFALKMNLDLVNKIIRDYGLTQETFAEAIGMSRPTVTAVLNGRAEASDKFLAAVAGTFDVSLHNLISARPVLRLGSKPLDRRTIIRKTVSR